MQALDANMIGGIAPATREVLQRVAVVGSTFDTDEFVALSGLPEDEAFGHLDAALAALVVEPGQRRLPLPPRPRARRPARRPAAPPPPPHPPRRRQPARSSCDASAARIGHHLLQAGATADAVPYLLRAAETEAAVGAYRDALALVDAVRPARHRCRTGRRRCRLRGDLLNAIGDPMAASAYREALDGAEPARGARPAGPAGALRRSCPATSRRPTAALDGLETDGGADDADILLARGKCAFFTSDFETAQAAAEEAQRLVLAGERNWKVLDLVALQGLLAHRTGSWFDRMRFELRRTRENPEIANAIFDGYLCPAEYMLYGPMPYAEVIAVARDLQTTARRSGALRAAAFASALIGEAALLSGDLELAATELDRGERAAPRPRLGRRRGPLVAAAGRGARRRGRRRRPPCGCCSEALPLARSSMIAKHLLQRIFGTMIARRRRPARGPGHRRPGRVDARVGRRLPVLLDHAVRAGDDRLRPGRRPRRTPTGCWPSPSSRPCCGRARRGRRRWPRPRPPSRRRAASRRAARTWLESAAEQFQRAGQPLDAERCRRALVALTDADRARRAAATVPPPS